MPRRAPAVSGTFYPANPARLRADVETYLGAARASPRRALAVIAPHAGYVFSGATAGLVFATVRVPATCIVLAPNHTGDVGVQSGGGVLFASEYETPLGAVAVDTDLGGRLLRAAPALLGEDAIAHAQEHSLEVILPFLQMRRPDVKIVPIVIAWSEWEESRVLAEAIAAVVGDRDDVLVVASSDMNHFESAVVTRAKDSLALERVTALDGKGLLALTREREITMCGRIPAAIACEYARLRGGRAGEVIAYSHSGLVNGDEKRVVGYAGVVLGGA